MAPDQTTAKSARSGFRSRMAHTRLKPVLDRYGILKDGASRFSDFANNPSRDVFVNHAANASINVCPPNGQHLLGPHGNGIVAGAYPQRRNEGNAMGGLNDVRHYRAPRDFGRRTLGATAQGVIAATVGTRSSGTILYLWHCRRPDLS